jgi:hypothetical protein
MTPASFFGEPPSLRRGRRWWNTHAMRRFRLLFPPDVRDEMQAIVEQAMRIGTLTSEAPWNVVAGHIEALRLARSAMNAIEVNLKTGRADR